MPQLRNLAKRLRTGGSDYNRQATDDEDSNIPADLASVLQQCEGIFLTERINEVIPKIVELASRSSIEDTHGVFFPFLLALLKRLPASPRQHTEG